MAALKKLVSRVRKRQSSDDGSDLTIEITSSNPGPAARLDEPTDRPQYPHPPTESVGRDVPLDLPPPYESHVGSAPQHRPVPPNRTDAQMLENRKRLDADMETLVSRLQEVERQQRPLRTLARSVKGSIPGDVLGDAGSRTRIPRELYRDRGERNQALEDAEDVDNSRLPTRKLTRFDIATQLSNIRGKASSSRFPENMRSPHKDQDTTAGPSRPSNNPKAVSSNPRLERATREPEDPAALLVHSGTLPKAHKQEPIRLPAGECRSLGLSPPTPPINVSNLTNSPRINRDGLGMLDCFYDRPDSRADSGLSLPDNPSQPDGRWKGKARAQEADESVSDALPGISSTPTRPSETSAQAFARAIADLLGVDLTEELENRDRAWAAAEEGGAPSPSDTVPCIPTDCVICTDTKPRLDFPASPVTANCTHPIRTCSDCLSSWLASELTENGPNNLKCPECAEALAHNEVRRSASPDTFATYDRLQTHASLASLPEFAWCLAPGCGSGQLNEELEYKNFMHCVSCDHQQCLMHRTPWHFGETCEEYDYRVSGQKASDDEAKTQAVLDDFSKLCPGPECNWRIEKVEGCDHMTCRKCQYQFCWECLASAAEIKRLGDVGHAENCHYRQASLAGKKTLDKASWPFNMH